MTSFNHYTLPCAERYWENLNKFVDLFYLPTQLLGPRRIQRHQNGAGLKAQPGDQRLAPGQSGLPRQRAGRRLGLQRGLQQRRHGGAGGEAR